MQSAPEREGATDSGLAKVLGPLIALSAGFGLWIVIFWTVFTIWPHR
jgi:hypothetical protein